MSDIPESGWTFRVELTDEDDDAWPEPIPPGADPLDYGWVQIGATEDVPDALRSPGRGPQGGRKRRGQNGRS